MTKFLLYMKLAGTEIKESKHVVIGLQSIYGIGSTRAKEILQKLNIPQSKKVKDLSSEDQLRLAEVLDQYVLGVDLKRIVLDNINQLVEKRCYVGLRHQKGLPSRGQRTKTNGRTARVLSPFKRSASKSSNTSSKSGKKGK